ncbi:MAG: phosphopyruvate hydratase [Paracoccaceae bacterium]
MSIIKKLNAREIIDSRGNPTLEVDVYLKSGDFGRASVPSGASTGKHEALELRDNNLERFHGKGVSKAVSAVNNEINSLLIGKNVNDQLLIDQSMIEADGTHNKSNLGANAILGVSIAVAQASSSFNKKPLYRNIFSNKTKFKLPMPMMNILNGGMHANNNLDIQEFMIIPISANSIFKAIQMGCEVFHTLKDILYKKNFITAVGDEGGFAPPLSNTNTALDLILMAIEKSGYKPGRDFLLALDCASSEYFKDKYYFMDGEKLKLNLKEKVDFLKTLVEKYPIISIEDGMSEDDWEGWKEISIELGKKCQLVGDDLFATNPDRLIKGINDNAGNAILIKYNQIGTLSETLKVIKIAKENNFLQIFSHRSGETEDVSISDLSVATEVGQIKTGSLSRTDRIAKYNQLIRIEQELGENCYISKDLARYSN